MMIKSQRHANIAVFVPHAGCPHQCSFCNQRHIAGQSAFPTLDEVRNACETARRTLSRDTRAELAFFGGSFTAIDRTVMVSLLEAAAPYVKEGIVEGIRVSTRPDAVDDKVLALLRSYGVTTVELGAQSMDNEVLKQCHRGHTAEQVEQAAVCVHGAGLSLGLQMMTGLPGDIDEGAWLTAQRLAALQPEQMRVYPTLVVEGTALAEAYRAGFYQPPSLEQAVTLGARLLTFFEEECQIPVIRLGLHAEEDLMAHLVAGPFHPAFRELCEGRLLFEKAKAALGARRAATVCVHPSCVSRMVGHRRENVHTFEQNGYQIQVVADATVAYGEIKVKEVIP